MRRSKKIMMFALAFIILLGGNITVNASGVMPLNGWCCPGAADIVIEEGWHVHNNSEWHQFKKVQCVACKSIKQICYY